MSSTNLHCLRSRLAQTPSMERDEATVRAAARQLANGVCVLTVQSGEARLGLRAISVALLSPNPATLLIGLDRRSASWAAFSRMNRFAVNVLAGDQREIAEDFADPADGDSGRFESGRWLQFDENLACLADCAAVFDCEAEETIERPAGVVVIARVRGALIGGSGALVRWRGAYDPLGWSSDEICRAVGLRPGGAA